MSQRINPMLFVALLEKAQLRFGKFTQENKPQIVEWIKRELNAPSAPTDGKAAAAGEDR